MTTTKQESSIEKKPLAGKKPSANKITSANKNQSNKTDDVSTFLSDLNTAIDSRSSSRRGHRNAINRFYYSVGTTNILLEQHLNVENISKRTINKVPHCKEWHEGIISIRGTIVPVINIKKFLQDKATIEVKHRDKENNEDTKNNTEQFLLMTHTQHPPIVFLIDKLPKMINIKDYTRERKPKKTPSWHTKQLISDNLTIVEADHNKLLKQIIKEQ